MMEAESFVETAVYIYQTTQRYITEDGHFPSNRLESMTSDVSWLMQVKMGRLR